MRNSHFDEQLFVEQFPVTTHVSSSPSHTTLPELSPKVITSLRILAGMY